MLVLTQKEGEVLQLGDDIRIYIKRVKGNMVRLCIDAPREVAIVRVPAVPARRPLNRVADHDESDDPGRPNLDLLAAGGLSHGAGDDPNEQAASALDTEAPDPTASDPTQD